MLWSPKMRKIIKVAWFIIAIFLILGMVLMYFPIGNF